MRSSYAAGVFFLFESLRRRRQEDRMGHDSGLQSSLTALSADADVYRAHQAW